MNPLELAVVQRKHHHLEELQELLRGESTTPLTAYLQDRRQQLVVERLLHLSVEAAMICSNICWCKSSTANRRPTPTRLSWPASTG